MVWKKTLQGFGVLLLSGAILLAGNMGLGEAAKAGSGNGKHPGGEFAEVLVRAQERDATFAPADAQEVLVRAQERDATFAPAIRYFM